MRRNNYGGIDIITLSRRNLEALIAKLDVNVETPGESEVMIVSPDGTFAVKGEENDEHYTDRPAGMMHPRDEANLSRPETGVKRSRW